jgi:hypothetical protein
MDDDMKAAALDVLRRADQIYRQADEHRTEMIGLAQRMGASVAEMREALGGPARGSG